MTEMIYGSMSQNAAFRGRARGYWRGTDRPLLIAILALFVIGLLLSMASSTALAEDHGLSQFYYVYRHLAYGALALGTMFMLSQFSRDWVRRAGVIGFFLALIAFLLLPIIGTNYGKGAVRWISIGFASIQPSELLKPGFVVLIAWLVSARKTRGGPPGRLLAFLITIAIAGLLVTQPDFGQALLFVLAFAAIMFIGGTHILWIGLLCGGVLIAGQIAYTKSDHVARRINDFLAGDFDPHTQIAYAANAISNGGLWGVGVGEGRVKYSLADAHTDFIIAVAAEEFGVLLAWIVTAIFAFIIARAFWRLMRIRDEFARLAGVGLTTLIGAQSMINLGVSARLIPTKGTTLPFISYGGSSLLAVGITFGFLLALLRARPDDEFKGEVGTQ